MALPSTVYKVTINLSDMDRGYYAEHSLTLARHPSETEERLMVRVFAFLMAASDSLEFGRGISCVEDPDLMERDLTGRILRWIDVGQIDLKRAKRALSQADETWLISYGNRATDVWWSKEGPALCRLERLHIYRIETEDCAALTALCSRNLNLQVMVQDGEFTIASGNDLINIRPRACGDKKR